MASLSPSWGLMIEEVYRATIILKLTGAVLLLGRASSLGWAANPHSLGSFEFRGKKVDVEEFQRRIASDTF